MVALHLLTGEETRHPVKLLCDAYTISKKEERAMKGVYKGAISELFLCEGSVGFHSGEERRFIYCVSGGFWPVLSLWCLGLVEVKADGQKELERLQKLW